MKNRFLALLLTLAALLAGLYPRTARAEAEASFDFFYDSLRPYGEWVQVADYGLCWHPSDVDENWAPYTDGYWSYTDGGWTWVSYEDYGGIVYHYGRWADVEDEGWCWVPDYDWAPAWVSWRHNDDYVGWAPLPPEAHFTASVGISTWADDTYDIGPRSYRFCRVHDFGAPVIREVCLPWRENVVIVRNTVNVTNIVINAGGFPFVGGPRFDFISARVRRPIPALVLVRETNVTNIVVNNRFGRGPVVQGFQRGNTLVLPAPRFRADAIRTAAVLPAGVRPAKVLAANKVNRGWAGVAANDRQALRAKVKEEVKGARPETHHARPVDVAELKPVPKKADPNAVVPGSTARTARGADGRTAAPAGVAVDRNHDGKPDAPLRVPGDRNGDGKPDAPRTGVAVDRNHDGKPDAPAAGVAVDKNRKGKLEAPPAGVAVDRNHDGKPDSPTRVPGDRDGDGKPDVVRSGKDAKKGGFVPPSEVRPPVNANPRAAAAEPVESPREIPEPRVKKGGKPIVHNPVEAPVDTGAAERKAAAAAEQRAANARAREAQAREQAAAARQKSAAAQEAVRPRSVDAPRREPSADAQRAQALEVQRQQAQRNAQSQAQAQQQRNAQAVEARERALRAQQQQQRAQAQPQPQMQRPQPQVQRPQPQVQPAAPAAGRAPAKGKGKDDDDDKKKGR